ncbi:MAG: ATP-dependent DNA helicase [Pseudonocardiaceae bacterium]
MITLEQCTGQQRAALDQIREWHEDGCPQQVYRQFGYAGTGKTSLARLIVAQLDLHNVKYAAYTGKAAQVLRSKGCDDVSTIHSLIYQPSGGSHEKLNALQAELARTQDEQRCTELADEIRAEIARLNQPFFTLRDESELTGADLLVLDEASMVNPSVGMDLESFGVPILVLGDPMQLPPVKGAGYFTNARPDNLLTEVQRSEADSPVTAIATAVRRGEAVPRIEESGRCNRMCQTDLLDYDQIIVGRRVTRWQIIRTVRRLLGYNSALPVPGDRIMVTCNSREAGVFNGQQFRVIEVSASPEVADALLLQVVDDEGRSRELPVWCKGFDGQAGEDALAASGAGRGKIAACTFAQAVTCHKAQGSQWPWVLVIDEAGAFRDMATRWLYTAVTRASDIVVVADPGAFRRGD